jgi:hypothetical protein
MGSAAHSLGIAVMIFSGLHVVCVCVCARALESLRMQIMSYGPSGIRCLVKVTS